MDADASDERAREDGPPTNAARKVNVAVAVFHSDDRLCRSIDELLGLGLTADQVILLARSGALSGRLLRAAGGLSDSVQVLGPADPIGAGPADGILRNQALHFEGWIPERYVSGLKQHLDDGGCILFVETRDDEWGRNVCEALLRHSVDSVQFHEFTRHA